MPCEIRSAKYTDLLFCHSTTQGTLDHSLLALCEQLGKGFIYGAPFFGAERHDQGNSENSLT